MTNILHQLQANRALWAGVCGWAAAQLIKILLEFHKTRVINLALLMSSGGMPSSHSSFVTALSAYIGFREGFQTPLFAVCAILSMVVMYDAAGVRRAAGKQAEAINMLVNSLENQGIKLDKKLKELLGHSPIEVAAGAFLGILIALIFDYNFL